MLISGVIYLIAKLNQADDRKIIFCKNPIWLTSIWLTVKLIFSYKIYLFVKKLQKSDVIIHGTIS